MTFRHGAFVTLVVSGGDVFATALTGNLLAEVFL